MVEEPCNIILVVGSLHEKSVTRVAINHLADNLSAAGCEVNTLDFIEAPLPLFNPDTVWEQDYYSSLKKQILKAALQAKVMHQTIYIHYQAFHNKRHHLLENFPAKLGSKCFARGKAFLPAKLVLLKSDGTTDWRHYSRQMYLLFLPLT